MNSIRAKAGMLAFALPFVVISPLLVAADKKDVSRPPNIVLLLADDLGWTGLRCFGSDLYETPHLDRLAEAGMKFTDAYSACTVCSPTRASIMTGMYPARLHLTDFIAGQNRPWAKLRIPDWTKRLEQRHGTIAEALHDAGYATAQIGKWHLSPPGKEAADYAPQQQGFDVEIPKPAAARGYFLPEGFNKKGESGSDYVTDYLTDRAVSTIDELKDRPFFLYMAYHTPHTPIQGRPDLVERFQKKIRAGATHNNPVYAAMLASLDNSVGRILARLEKHGLAENTLVIFTSDNGGLTQRNGKHDGFTENLPLRRGKGSAYEGGVRVPAIVRWPGVAKAGSVCDEPVMTIDYYPTMLAAARAKGNADHNQSIDGQSLLPLLKNPIHSLDRNLFWHYPHYHAGGDSPYSAVRSGKWRLIEFHEDQRIALFDLAGDIGETTDQAAKYPEVAKRLRGELNRWRKEVGAQMPTPNPEYDAERATTVRRNR